MNRPVINPPNRDSAIFGLIIPAMIAVFSSQAHAELLETFPLKAELVSVTGPEYNPNLGSDEYQIWCRTPGEYIVGTVENWGSVSLTYDHEFGTTGPASLTHWNGTGTTRVKRYATLADGSEQLRMAASFHFSDAGVDYPQDGFVSSFTESIAGLWINVRQPAFTGTYKEIITNTDANSTARCVFLYTLSGGVSANPRDTSIFNELTNFLRDIIVDDSQSENVLPVTNRTAILGVRG